MKDNPQNKAEQDKLKAASMHLRMITNSTTDNALKKAMAAKLENCAKQASAAMTRLIGVGQHTASYNTNPAKHKEFMANSEVWNCFLYLFIYITLYTLPCPSKISFTLPSNFVLPCPSKMTENF